MGIFGSIGRALGGVAKGLGGAAKGAVGGFLKGGPLGALTGGASGALGSLFAGGGLGGAIKGGLLGAAGGAIGQQAGLSPAAIAAISGIASSQLTERGKQRESAEAAFNARQDLLTRNLTLAERSFADKAPLRNFGMNSLGRFAQGGFGRGIFNTPGEMGQVAGSLEGAPIFQGNSLFGGADAFGLAGREAPSTAFKPSDVKPSGPVVPEPERRKRPVADIPPPAFPSPVDELTRRKAPVGGKAKARTEQRKAAAKREDLGRRDETAFERKQRAITSVTGKRSTQGARRFRGLQALEDSADLGRFE